jgi:hypothetical protein
MEEKRRRVVQNKIATYYPGTGPWRSLRQGQARLAKLPPE